MVLPITHVRLRSLSRVSAQLFTLSLTDYTGASSERGGPLALNLNLNYPLHLGTDNEKYLSTLKEAVQEVTKFSPEILFVS